MLKLKRFFASQINVIQRKIDDFGLHSLTVYTLLICCLASRYKHETLCSDQKVAMSDRILLYHRDQIVPLKHAFSSLRCIIKDG